ncbi:hypothetical protein GA0115238_121939, partial [Streptomyces sp. di50b]
MRACGLSAGQPPYSLPSAQTSEPPDGSPGQGPTAARELGRRAWGRGAPGGLRPLGAAGPLRARR